MKKNNGEIEASRMPRKGAVCRFNKYFKYIAILLIISLSIGIIVLESALIKAMVLASIVLAILNLIGVIPSIILLLVIIALTTSVSITIETVIWKRTAVVVVKKQENAEKPKLPEIIHGRLISKN